MIVVRRKRREPPSSGAGLATPGSGMPVTPMTWIGLAIVGFGWTVQVLGGIVNGLGSHPSTQPTVVAIAQSLMLTGFGLAVLSALQNGFGALNRFFETVAQRSVAAAKAAPAPAPAPMVTVPERQNEQRMQDGPRVRSRGRIGDRPYMQFADGSVEVETLLGTRRFESLDEARVFIGG